jgi:hypothetical protein
MQVRRRESSAGRISKRLGTVRNDVQCQPVTIRFSKDSRREVAQSALLWGLDLILN